MLNLAATTSEANVEMALTLLLDAGALTVFDAVRGNERDFRPALLPQHRLNNEGQVAQAR